MADIIDVTDLPSALQAHEQAALWVAGANAAASRIAPCLASTDPEPSDDQLAEARLILVGAVSRWAEAGAGALQQQTAGPFSVTTDTRSRGGYKLWPSDIEQLQDICGGEGSEAFSVDTVAAATSGTWTTPYTFQVD